jgi:hypothetical protein
MRSRYVIAMGITLACAGPLVAQEQLVVARPLPTFAVQTGRRSPPKAAVLGMVIGGVVGAGVGAYLVLGHPCREGWECMLRPALAMFEIGIGATVGFVIGGAVGNAIGREHEFNVGIRLPLPIPH